MLGTCPFRLGCLAAGSYSPYIPDQGAEALETHRYQGRTAASSIATVARVIIHGEGRVFRDSNLPTSAMTSSKFQVQPRTFRECGIQLTGYVCLIGTHTKCTVVRSPISWVVIVTPRWFNTL